MVSQKPWDADAVVRLFLGIISTLCFGMVLDGVAEYARIGWTQDQRLLAQMVIATIFFQLAALIWIQSFLRACKLSWRQAFGFGNPGQGRAIVLAMLAAVAVFPMAILLQDISGWIMESLRMHPEPQIVVQELQKPNVPLAETVFLGVLAIGIAPVAEEVMFRGILYPTVKQLGYPRAALFGTSLLFGLSHFSLVTLVPLTLFAIMLVYLYEATDNLWVPIACHATFNALNFFLLLFREPLERLLHF